MATVIVIEQISALTISEVIPVGTDECRRYCQTLIITSDDGNIIELMLSSESASPLIPALNANNLKISS